MSRGRASVAHRNERNPRCRQQSCQTIKRIANGVGNSLLSVGRSARGWISKQSGGLFWKRVPAFHQILDLDWNANARLTPCKWGRPLSKGTNSLSLTNYWWRAIDVPIKSWRFMRRICPKGICISIQIKDLVKCRQIWNSRREGAGILAYFKPFRRRSSVFRQAENSRFSWGINKLARHQ